MAILLPPPPPPRKPTPLSTPFKPIPLLATARPAILSTSLLLLIIVMASIESLPAEIIIHIAKQGSPADINSLLRTNRTFSALLGGTLLDSAVSIKHPEVAQQALYAAADRGDDESVLRLLRRGAIAVIGEDLVLHEAIEEEPEHVVCNLWRNGARIVSPGEQGRTPIMLAAEQGYTEAVRMMMEFGGFDINEQDVWLRTALYTAACEGNESTVEMLMTHPDIDLNMTDQFGDTPLHAAAECGWGRIAKILLSDPRTIVNAKDARSMAPLHIALILDHLEVAEALLQDPRVNVNEPGQRDRTPLHIVAIQKQMRMVRMLLQHPDIDATVPNGSGRLALSFPDADPSYDWDRTPPHVVAALQGYDEPVPDAANDEDMSYLVSGTPLHRAAYYYSSLMLVLAPQNREAEASSYVSNSSDDSSAIALARRQVYVAEISQAILDHEEEKSRASAKRELDAPMQTRSSKKAREA